MVEQEEDEVRISSFPLLKARRPADHIEPRIHLNQSPDTPHSVRASTEAPHSEHRHPSNEHQAKLNTDARCTIIEPNRHSIEHEPENEPKTTSHSKHRNI